VPTTLSLPPIVIERIRNRLEDERAELVDRLAGARRAVSGTTATSGHGETEHVQLEAERALATVLDAATRTALEDLVFALARLDDGSYGVCAACGLPIPLERLEAVPTTRRCVPCQEHRERRP
jgi:DnaK suppressor protein